MGNASSKRNRNAAAAPTAGAAVAPTEDPATPTPVPGEIGDTVALGAGCYWGTEKYIKKDFQEKFPNSIKRATVGFMSPEAQPRFRRPSYKDVCTGRTGHVEVLFVKLNDPAANFEELIRFFFMFHDPTTKNRQGNDRGTQYASWIFCADAAQTAIAKRMRDELQGSLDKGNVRAYANKTVTTAIGPLREFTKAEEHHQRYLEKHPQGYCNHRIRFKTWPGP